jgi:hypothetical protein
MAHELRSVAGWQFCGSKASTQEGQDSRRRALTSPVYHRKASMGEGKEKMAAGCS